MEKLDVKAVVQSEAHQKLSQAIKSAVSDFVNENPDDATDVIAIVGTVLGVIVSSCETREKREQARELAVLNMDKEIRSFEN